MTAAALFAIGTSTNRGRAFLRFVATFVGAVLLHAAWDGSTNVIVHVLVAGVSVAGLLVVIHRTRRSPGTQAAHPVHEHASVASTGQGR